MPQTGKVTRRAHPPVWGGPLHAQRGLLHKAQDLLAQGAEVGHQLFLVNPYRHPSHRVLSAPHPPPSISEAKTGRP